MDRETEEKNVVSDEAVVAEQVKIEEPKDCPVTEEEVSFEDDSREAVGEEPTEIKVSSLQAAIAAMKTGTSKTEMKPGGGLPPKSGKKKPAAPTKRGSGPKSGGSGIKKRNTPRKAPAPRPSKNSGKGSSTNGRAVSGKSVRGKNGRPPTRGERTKSKSPGRKSGKAGEKKRSKDKATRKSRNVPKEDEKTVLRLRFVIGENGVINGGADQ